jgi:hypothetical protein
MLIIAAAAEAAAQTNRERSLEIYGFVMTDFGVVFGRINPGGSTHFDRLNCRVSENEFNRGENFSGASNPFRLKGNESTQFGVLSVTNLQWARRTNFADGFRTNDYKLQFSLKFSFKGIIEGAP